MRTAPRIRPRHLLQAAQPARQRTPWQRLPLALIFRNQRSTGRSIAIAAHALAAPSNSTSIFATHIHHHAHASARILNRLAQRNVVMFSTTGTSVINPPALLRLQTIQTRDSHSEKQLRTITEHTRERTIRTLHQHTQITNRAIAPRRTDSPLAPGRESSSATTLFIHNRPTLRTTTILSPTPRTESRIERVTTVRHPLTVPALRHRLDPRQHGATTITPQRTQFNSPPAVDQIWRQSAPKPLHAHSEPPGGHPASTSRHAETPRANAPAPATTPSSPSTFKIEGPTMDRLADDVMKRIDRHIRIERERRGL